MGGEHDDAWADPVSHEVWAALRAAAPLIIERLAPEGIIGAHFVVGFVHPFGVHVWLATATDAQRDALAGPDRFLAEVREAVASSGFPAEHATIEGTVIESQETVDRECGGSWYHAQR